MKQNWMQDWHYSKGLVYYKAIFRLTKLAFLVARAIPLWRKATFLSKLKWHFYGLKSLVFYLKQHQTIYLGVLKRKATFEENANFWLKLWFNPFGKMQIFRLSWNDIFWSKRFCFLFKTSSNYISWHFQK